MATESKKEPAETKGKAKGREPQLSPEGVPYQMGTFDVGEYDDSPLTDGEGKNNPQYAGPKAGDQ